MAEAETEATLHRAAREAKPFGNRAVREALEVRELDHGALLLGKSRERRGKAGLSGLIVEDARERLLRVLVRDHLRDVRSGTRSIRRERHDLEMSRASAAAGEVDGAAMHHGHDERIQASVLADAVGALPEREEGRVDGILGGGAVAEDAVRESERATAVGAIELRECRGVAGLEPAGEFTIIGGWRDVAAPLAGYSRGRGCRITEVCEVFGAVEVIQRRSSCESPASRLREPVPGEES